MTEQSWEDVVIQAVRRMDAGNRAQINLLVQVLMKGETMTPLGFGGRQATHWAKKIARGEPFEGGSAIRILACEIVRLETLLRQVHPGLFADEDLPQTEPAPKNAVGD